MQYLGNMVQYAVAQAPQRVKTKGKYLRKFSVEPGLQGKTRVLRSQEHLYAFVYFYLNFDGANQRQAQRLVSSFEGAQRTLRAESGYRVHLIMMNYFMFFWRYELFLGRRFSRRVKAKVQKCVNAHGHLRQERAIYRNVATNVVRHVRRGVRRWRREQYFKRTLYPMVSAFIFQDFDAEIVTRAVAMELQILRIYHRRFLRYAQRVIQLSINHTQAEQHWLEGLELRLKGRLTSFRRQERRSGIKTLRFGALRLKKSDLRRESSHCAFIAYNRYGVISVQMTYQRRPQEFRHWSGESQLRPEVVFGGEALLEVLGDRYDVGDPGVALRARLPFLPSRSPRTLHSQLLHPGSFAPAEDQPAVHQHGLLAWDSDEGRYRSELSTGRMQPVSLTGLLLQYRRRCHRTMALRPGLFLLRPRSRGVLRRHSYTTSFRQKDALLPFHWEQHTLVNFLRRRRSLARRP